MTEATQSSSMTIDKDALRRKYAEERGKSAFARTVTINISKSQGSLVIILKTPTLP